jgi:creatine kinase
MASRFAALSRRTLGASLATTFTAAAAICYEEEIHEKRPLCEAKTEHPAATQTTADTEAKTEHPAATQAAADTDSYPNFSRHGKQSLLKQYLTEEVYNNLKDLRTANGVTLEDLIRSGVSLPWGAKPPRGISGVFAGDAESYHTFSDLLNPLIDEHHKPTYRVRLQRHKTNLNPAQLLKQQLDPEGAYILYTRLRLARSLAGFAFAPCIDRAARRQIERLFKECVEDWKNTSTGATGKYVSIMEMSNEQHEDLIQRQILFPDPDDFAVAAGLARDWPDARGIYCDDWRDTPAIMMWCNAEDHFWIVSTSKGGDVQNVFTRLTEAVWALETSLGDRGYGFEEDRRLGFLNTSPANIGTALRASVITKLVRLGSHPGFFEFIKKLRLEAKAEYEGTDKHYTGIFSIANAEALGKSEVTLINIMIKGVGQLIELEKRLEKGEAIDLSTIEVEIVEEKK